MNQSKPIELIFEPKTQIVTVDDPSPTISVLWDQAVQQAVINTKVGPTVASRAYGMLHTAMFDTWAAYDPVAIATQLGDELQRPDSENIDANKAEAMSFAAYRILTELFPSDVGIFDDLMAKLGFDPSNTTDDTTTAAGIGNVSAEALLEFRRFDGSNQLGNYSDTTGYQPVNTPEQIVDIERWTPEHVPIDDLDKPLQKFLTPQWGEVIPFGLESGDQFRPEAPQPFLLVDGEVDLKAGNITLEDGSVVEINRDIVGTIINPEFIQQVEEIVEVSANLTDEQKLIAEFWENGGGTPFPPGTWMTFGQFVSARDNHSLDDDAKLFFTLGNSVFDAGIATWESKMFYDYTRPVRAVHELGKLGLIGEFNEDLGGFAIEAWGGPGKGTQTILATDFITYQTPGGNASPPFAEYTSGHSAYSAASATILELFTGSEQFDASVTFAPGQSRFEPNFTPQEEDILAWETFSSASDQAGISRTYGGIHFKEGDLNGRALGQQVAAAVFEQAQFFIEGAEDKDFLFGTRGSDKLVGTKADEKIYARSGDDFVAGGLGNDVIFGNDGNDHISGKAGNDSLYGDKGKDKIFGGSGDDLLWGGLGNDKLLGGSGRDTFVIAADQGINTIVDFQIGKDFLGLTDGLEFGQLSINLEGKNTLIGFADDALAILKGVTDTLSSADFVAIV